MIKFNNKIQNLAKEALELCDNAFSNCEKIAEYNSNKVLSAFIENKISETHFVESSGYGYNDIGREALESVYSSIFRTEKSLVRHQLMSGTHALTVALFGLLRPHDLMISLAGEPYDTLKNVIHKTDKNLGSLADFLIDYKSVDLKNNRLDFSEIENALRTHKPKLAYLQRSRGYHIRPSITVEEIEKVASIIKKVSPDTIFMVDNCYGELAEKYEPTEVGADIMAGSLIKNPGGAIANTGGYITGKENLVNLCAHRYSTSSTGDEIGASLGQTKSMLKGIYYATSAVENAMKSAIFTSALFSKLGFTCSPNLDEKRTDIIEVITLKSKEALLAFCKGIQSLSAVDSFVTPVPSSMPGYEHEVIMAAGAFTLGSSIELSADAPIKEPFNVFMQGGVHFHMAKLAITKACELVLETL